MTNVKSIDAVITWVDGNDQKLQDKKNLYLQSEINPQIGTGKTLFADSGEIEFCVRSLFKYAPWVGSIFIVTDNQVPTFISKMKSSLQRRIKIIDHSELFKKYEHILPVFNSLAIETLLWNIDELSDDFIYLNDDMMLVRPTPIEAFIDNDKYIFNYSIKKFRKSNFASKLRDYFRSQSKFSFRKVKERSARLVMHEEQIFYLDLPHCPYIMNKKILKKILDMHPEEFLNNLSYKFRNKKQLWSVGLFTNYIYYRGKAKISNQFKTGQIKGKTFSKTRIKKELKALEDDPQIYFFCIQSMDQMSENNHNIMLNWLQQHYQSI